MSSYDYNTSDTRISMEYWKSISYEDRITSTQYPRMSTITSSVASALVNVTSSTIITSGSGNLLEGLIVPLYATIFLLAVIGNSLVLVTLARNKRMRTVTNVYLLNLAVSDLLLGVFCMPFTLLGQMLKNFVFGTTMCKLIPYFQAVSVSVGVWTLVAISLERYFAICRPLKSRRWQTQFHAYKMIAVVWAGSLTWNAPILAVSRLKAIRGGRHKCREEWPSIGSEQAYNLFLDGMLLLLPLVVMILAYSLIVTKLWRGLRREIKHSSTCQRQLERIGSSATVNGITANPCNDEASDAKTNVVALGRQQTLLPLPGCPLQGVSTSLVRKNRTSDVARPKTKAVKRWLMKGMIQGFQGRGTTPRRVSTCRNDATLQARSPVAGYENGIQVRIDRGGPADGEETNNIGCDEQQDTTYTFSRHAIRSNYMEKSIEAKKKVIRMLFVVVLEFFVCWAPLHVVNTWCLFYPELVYSLIGSTGISLVQLLAYISSCCNPITYCFMNRKFRQAFLGIFDCYRCWSISCGSGDEDASAATTRNATQAGNSELSGNDSTIYLGRASLVARSGNSSDGFLPVRSEITRVAILLQKWCSWRRRIVFSSGYGVNNGLPGPSGNGPSTSGLACPVIGPGMSGSLSSNRLTAASLCVDLEPEEENFLLRISWRPPPPPLSPVSNQNVNGSQKVGGYSHSALQLYSSGYSCTDDLKFLYD